MGAWLETAAAAGPPRTDGSTNVQWVRHKRRQRQQDRRMSRVSGRNDEGLPRPAPSLILLLKQRQRQQDRRMSRVSGRGDEGLSRPAPSLILLLLPLISKMRLINPLTFLLVGTFRATIIWISLCYVTTLFVSLEELLVVDVESVMKISRMQ